MSANFNVISSETIFWKGIFMKGNIQILTNAELVQKLNLLVKEERKLSMEILRYLREVETRRLYAKMGYGSIYEFCIKELKYSEGAAHRRISSMRLLKELPQVDRKSTRLNSSHSQIS